MYILGVASSLAETILSDQLLAARSCSSASRPASSLALRTGVSSRRISIPLELLNTSRVATPLGSWEGATVTPTTLGVQAVRSLLSRTGVALEEISLVLGDCGTPYQTCPSEAQRVMGELGMKTAAYDLIGGISAVPLMLSVLSRWSPARFVDKSADDSNDSEASDPKGGYILLLSVNTPSQQINYQSGGDVDWLCGDAATALLIKTAQLEETKQRLYSVTHQRFRVEDGGRQQPIVVEEFVRLNPQAVLNGAELRNFLTNETTALRAINPMITSEAVFIAPQLYAEEAKGVLVNELGIAPSRVVSGVDDCGFTLGSSYGIALERAFNLCSAGELAGAPIVLLHCGDGRRGSLVLTSR